MFFILDLQVWVNDGCNTKGDPPTEGSFQDKSYLAGVRCCSVDGTTCETPGSCPTDNMSYDDATQKCAELGRRLCTKDELVGGVCCGSGGMCNKYEVWSSSSPSMHQLFDYAIPITNLMSPYAFKKTFKFHFSFRLDRRAAYVL